MAQHRIVCTQQQPFNQPTTHAHIVAVGIGTTATRYDRMLTLDEVLLAMHQGDQFYTIGTSSGKVALVEPFHCAGCRRTFIRSRPDTVYDNNLDSLNRCAI